MGDLYTQPDIIPNFNRLSTSPTAPYLIGLMGRAGAGKDTVGNIITRLYGHQQKSFAANLKEALYRLNPYCAFPGTDKLRVQDVVDALGWDEAKKVNADDPSGIRGLLQRLGTEVGREMFGEEFWVKQAMKNVAPPGVFVFTDVRFPNEAAAVHQRRGKVYRVIRPGVENVLAHASETALDDYEPDGIIVNDGSLLDLEGEVQRVLGEFDV